METERLTSQKKIILEYLEKTRNHPTAEQVYNNVRKKLPQISKGTVYRILKGFHNKGKVLGIPVAGVTHFDGNTLPHAHFICQKCNKIYDVFDVCGSCDILKNKKLKVGDIKNYKIYFYGVCKKCKK